MLCCVVVLYVTMYYTMLCQYRMLCCVCPYRILGDLRVQYSILRYVPSPLLGSWIWAGSLPKSRLYYPPRMTNTSKTWRATDPRIGNPDLVAGQSSTSCDPPPPPTLTDGVGDVHRQHQPQEEVLSSAPGAPPTPSQLEMEMTTC